MSAEYSRIVADVTRGVPQDGSGLANIEVGLAIMGALFLSTFFVAPRFKENFKEDTPWADMYAALLVTGVKSLSPEEAAARRRSGAVIMDVRMQRDFERDAIEGAINVPLYRPISGFGLAANIRRAGFSFFGVYGSEMNPNFGAEAAAALSSGKEVIVVCGHGGSMKQAPGVKTGFMSQSLKAVYRLQSAGFTKVSHLSGGFPAWRREIGGTVSQQGLEGLKTA